MKILSLILFSSFFSLSLYSQNVLNTKRTRPPRRPTSTTGGIVEKKYTGNVLRIVNLQQTFPKEKIEKLTRDMRWMALLPFETVSEDIPDAKCLIDIASSFVGKNNASAIVVIAENDKLPLTLISPERKWTILNISPLLSDNPNSKKIEERIKKMLWVSVARTLGAGNSSYRPCVLAPFTTIHDLDKNLALKPCPEPFNKMIDTAASYGIKTITISSYKKACEEGWAHAPTNDIQKAIWDKVHAMPTAPIKIKPEAKKVKE